MTASQLVDIPPPRPRAFDHLTDSGQLELEYARLREANKRLANQRKAMLHILADYELDRRRLVQQTERLQLALQDRKEPRVHR